MIMGMTMIDEQDDDADDGDAHHVLVEENIDGVWVVSIWTVVEGKLLNQKKDHCDHKLSEGTIMVITMTDENEDHGIMVTLMTFFAKNGRQWC